MEKDIMTIFIILKTEKDLSKSIMKNIAYCLKENIPMEKEMEKEKNIILMVKSGLKANILTERNGTEKYF